MNKIITKIYNSPIGSLIIGSYGSDLCLCDWQYRKMRNSIDERIIRGLEGEYITGDSPVIAGAVSQLEDYFRGNRKVFDIPLLFIGTDFQKKVWNELIQISYGETSSYGELSERLGNRDAVRAVAAANGANALSIFVPCHRIVGSRGELVGYAGGLKAKEKLLNLESSGYGQLNLFSPG